MLGRPAVRLGATAVAVVLVAEAAVWLLRPRDGAVEPAKVSETAYFPEQQIERARDYRGGQRWLMVGGLAAEGAVLVLLAAGRPAPARRALERLGARPVRGGAAAAAGIYAAVTVVSLPFAVAAHERAVDVGLSTQSIAGWGADLGKATAIGAAIAAGAGAVAIGLMRRLGRRWWLAASGVAIAFEVLMIWIAPVVIAPLFNRFDELERGSAAREDALELARRAGVDVGEVYRVDASRRTTGLNAFVDGLGSTKRVVLFDTLIDEADRDERRSVIAHELSHAKGRDVPRGLLWVAIATPLAFLLAARLAERIAKRAGAEPASPAALPAVALSLGLVAIVLSPVGNQLSRAVEARADTFALQLTDDPQALISLQQRLTESNVSDPDPPALVSTLLGTHPPAVERIGAAVAWERGERP